MTNLGRRYIVCLKLHLRRFCAAALLVLCLPVAAGAKIVESSSVAAALELVDAFDALCSAQVEQELIADKSHLIALNEDQIAGLSTVLGYREAPEAIWSHRDDAWYQVQRSLEVPATCLIVSFNIALEDMRLAWEERYSDVADWQSFSEPSIERAGTEGSPGATLLSGAFAFRPFEGQVVVAGVAGMQMKDTGVVMLRYQKTAAIVEDCDAGNGECP